MASKFSVQAADLNEAIRLQFVEAVRKAIKLGLEEAIRSTFQDSSQAAAYWQVGIVGKNSTDPRDRNPAARGGRSQLVDIRGEGSVGFRGDRRLQDEAVTVEVSNREWRQAIDKYLRGERGGHWFPTNIYFYNKVGELKKPGANGNSYPDAAYIEQAGTNALAKAVAEFENNIRNGKIRKRKI